MLEETRLQPVTLHRTLDQAASIDRLRRRFERTRPRLIVLAARGTSDNAAQFGRYLIEITTRNLYTPIPYIVPAQLFAAHLAALRGLDPDRPRTLRKITRTL